MSLSMRRLTNLRLVDSLMEMSSVRGAGSIALAHAVNDSYAYILPPLLPIPASIAALLMWRLAPTRPGRMGAMHLSLLTVLRRNWHLLAVLIGVVAVRSWASTTLVTFLPTLATEHGAHTTEAAQVL